MQISCFIRADVAVVVDRIAGFQELPPARRMVAPATMTRMARFVFSAFLFLLSGRLVAQMPTATFTSPADGQTGKGARVIAGAGHARGKSSGDIARLVEAYGGEASEWAKMSGRSFKSSIGQQIEVHWYEYIPSGDRYEFKTKLVKGWE